MKYASLFITAFFYIAACSHAKDQAATENIGKNMDEQKKEVPFNKNNWQQTPHIKGKVANENDVKERRAIFTIDPKKGVLTPLNIKIPSLAYHIDQETKERILVVVIQAEQCGDKKVAGIRYSDGSEGACLLYELEFLDNYPE